MIWCSLAPGGLLITLRLAALLCKGLAQASHGRGPAGSASEGLTAAGIITGGHGST